MADDQPTKNDLIQHEPELLRGLLAAGDDRQAETITIEIARKGRVYFTFRLRPLSETEWDQCQEQATKYKRNRRLGGITMPERTDAARFRSLLIYTATDEGDRKALWDNKQAWQHFDVTNGADLIDAVLMAGEKDAVIQRLEDISGYGGDLEETAKNS